MNGLESAIVATLRAEAEGAAMTTDTPDQFEILSDRLDDVDGADRRRRRSWLAVGAVAAAAAVAVAAVAVLGRSAPPPAAPVEPASGPLFRATQFQPAFSANVPAWVAEVMTAPTEETSDTVTWNRCEERPVCIGLDAYTIRYLTRGSTEPATYAGYLARIEKLRRAGALDVTDSRQTTVDGRPATVFTMLTKGDTADGMGCFTTLRCQDFYTENLARYAVVDTGSAPLVIGMRTFVDNPQGRQWIDQLGGVLATMTLPPPSYPSAQDLVGMYDATLTLADAKAALAGGDLSKVAQRVLDRVTPGAASVRLRLYVDPTTMRLYSVDAAGREKKIDEQATDLVDGRMTGVHSLGSGQVETMVLDAASDADGLRFTWVDGAGPQTDPVAPVEAFQRALYAATVWTRMT